MHRQVSQPRQEAAEEPSEPGCDESDPLLVKSSKNAGAPEGTGATGSGLSVVNEPSGVLVSHSTGTGKLSNHGADGSEAMTELHRGSKAVQASKADAAESDCETPPLCRKAIKNLGLEKGSLRTMITTHLMPKNSKGEGSTHVLPDDAESCQSPEEEIMVACTPAMIDLLSGSDRNNSDGKKMEKEGAPLSKILQKLKNDNSESSAKLGEELSQTKILTRRRKLSKPINQGDAVTLKNIRQMYAERQYQKLIGPDVAGCINALKVRTADRWRDQTLAETRFAYSAGFSALVVFAASFLVGYYFAMFVLGIKTIGMQILFGSISAVLGGLLEAVLLVLAYGRLDANRAANKVK